MLIKFYNLGSIKETELDLRPLTVIIGPNNSNKTYIAYSVYALWEKMAGSNPNIPYSIDVKKNIEQKDENTWILKITKDFIETLLINSSQKFQLKLDSFFQDSTHRLFSNTKFGIAISHNEISKNLRNINNIEVSIPDGKLKFVIDRNSLLIHLNRNEPQISSPISIDIVSLLIFIIPHIIFPKPVILPAERNAFILTYKLLSNRRYRLLKNNQLQFLKKSIPEKQIEIFKEQGDMGYPKPIEDFLDFLVDVEMIKNYRTDQSLQQIADNIEQYIQNKNKTCFESLKLGKELKVKVKKGLTIDLHNASSSIKQLAPLLLYLRYQAKKNDFLIIDEPELGLHPESQAKLLEALAIMVNLGIRVLITTHSPYFMSHLNNIVSGEINNPEILTQQASSLYLNDSRAFLSMDQVSAYEMKRNKLRSLKDKDFGIRWDTLSDVSSDIQQKYFEIHEKKEMFLNGKK